MGTAVVKNHSALNLKPSLKLRQCCHVHGSGWAYKKFPSGHDPSLVAPSPPATQAPAPLQAQEQTLPLLSPARRGGK